MSGFDVVTPERPHLKNAPGSFIVSAGECMACGAPEAVASDLMAHVESDGHCYFHRQPATAEEIDRACEAVLISCCGAVKYVGDDASIQQRLSVLAGVPQPIQEPALTSKPWWKFW